MSHPLYPSSEEGKKDGCLFTLEHYRKVLNFVNIGLWAYQPSSQVMSWNPKMYELYDLEEKKFSSVMDAWMSLMNQEQRQTALDDIQKAISEDKQFYLTVKIMSREGKTKYIGSKGIVIRDHYGQAEWVYGISWDKTEEVEYFLDSKKQKDLLDQVMSNIPNTVFVKSSKKNMRYVLFNQAGCDLIGVEQGLILGKNDFDLFPEEQAKFFTEKDQEVFQKKEVLKIDKEPISTPKGERWLETYKVPTFDENGEPELLIGISTDITEELELEKELEAEKQKSLQSAKLATIGEMAAGIVHEINNPLSIILGHLSLLPNCFDNVDAMKAKIQIIEKSANRIHKIIMGLKKFSRSSERTEFQINSIAGLFEETSVLVSVKAKKYSVKLSFEAAGRCDVYCNSVEMEQVLINLIHNAIDAVRDLEEKWVKVKAFEDDGSVVIQVLDSGSGLTTDQEENIFQPFYTTKAVGEGTGLGLSISKGILEQHHAEFKVNRNFKNTCFEIRFQRSVEDKASA